MFPYDLNKEESAALKVFQKWKSRSGADVPDKVRFGQAIYILKTVLEAIRPIPSKDQSKGIKIPITIDMNELPDKVKNAVGNALLVCEKQGVFTEEVGNYLYSQIFAKAVFTDISRESHHPPPQMVRNLEKAVDDLPVRDASVDAHVSKLSNGTILTGTTVSTKSGNTVPVISSIDFFKGILPKTGSFSVENPLWVPPEKRIESNVPSPIVSRAALYETALQVIKRSIKSILESEKETRGKRITEANVSNEDEGKNKNSPRPGPNRPTPVFRF